jgi:hypothetical protein
MIINPKNPTELQVASSYELWSTYVDPDGEDTEEAFNAMSLQQRLDWIDTLFYYEKLNAE